MSCKTAQHAPMALLLLWLITCNIWQIVSHCIPPFYTNFTVFHPFYFISTQFYFCNFASFFFFTSCFCLILLFFDCIFTLFNVILHLLLRFCIISLLLTALSPCIAIFYRNNEFFAVVWIHLLRRSFADFLCACEVTWVVIGHFNAGLLLTLALDWLWTFHIMDTPQ